MTVLYDVHKGKVKFFCKRCGKQSKRLPDMSGAREELSRHNLRHHPNVFPRWNPDKKVVETERGPR